MSSKLSSPKHIGKGSGWVLLEDPLRKPRRKRVSPRRGRRDAGGLHFKASAEPAHSCCTLPVKNTDFFPPKQRILSVLQNHVSKRTAAKEARKPSFLFRRLQAGREERRWEAGNSLQANAPRTQLEADRPASRIARGWFLVPLHWVPAQILPKALPTSGRRR